MTVDGIDGFVPYGDDGWQKVIETSMGRMSIRFGGSRLFVSATRPFEVWYPGEDAPSGIPDR